MKNYKIEERLELVQDSLDSGATYGNEDFAKSLANIIKDYQKEKADVIARIKKIKNLLIQQQKNHSVPVKASKFLLTELMGEPK